jgi:hypothetical protein
MNEVIADVSRDDENVAQQSLSLSSSRFTFFLTLLPISAIISLSPMDRAGQA